MVTIKAACKVFLMDLTQVYKILRLYFASGKKKNPSSPPHMFPQVGQMWDPDKAPKQECWTGR